MKVTVGILPFRENSHGRARKRTRDLMISSQRLWPLDHKAGQGYRCYSGQKIGKGVSSCSLQNMRFIFGCVFILSAEEMCVCVCVCRGVGGIFLLACSSYKCFSSHMYGGNGIPAESFHSGVGNDILVNRLHHILAKIQHFDILRNSCALIIGEHWRFSLQWFVGFIFHPHFYFCSVYRSKMFFSFYNFKVCQVSFVVCVFLLYVSEFV